MTEPPRPAPDPAAFPADGAADQRARFLLRYAVLAPSSHNSQPWRFAVDGEEIRVFADESRQLTVADPDRRELHLSVGCALETLVVAADHFDVPASVEYVPDGERRRADGDVLQHVATVRLDQGQPSDGTGALFEAITERYTSHEEFRPAPIPQSLRERLGGRVDTSGAARDHRTQRVAQRARGPLSRPRGPRGAQERGAYRERAGRRDSHTAGCNKLK